MSLTCLKYQSLHDVSMVILQQNPNYYLKILHYRFDWNTVDNRSVQTAGKQLSAFCIILYNLFHLISPHSPLFMSIIYAILPRNKKKLYSNKVSRLEVEVQNYAFQANDEFPEAPVSFKM